MLLATFGPSTTWAGKTLTFEDGQFILEGHGPVSREAVAKYDREGHLAWEGDNLSIWFHAGGTSPPMAISGDGESEVGTFHSVHPMATVMEVVCAGIRGELSSGEVVQGEPGVMASIYVGQLTEDRVVVTAGNVLEAYFSFVVELAAADDGTRGRAYYDRPMKKITRWYKNAMELASAVQRTLDLASTKIDAWDIGGSVK